MPKWFRDGPSCRSQTSGCISLEEGPMELSGAFFIRVQIPFMKALLSRPTHLPKSPPPNTVTLGNRILTYEFLGKTNMQIIAPAYPSMLHEIVFQINLAEIKILLSWILFYHSSNTYRNGNTEMVQFYSFQQKRIVHMFWSGFLAWIHVRIP